MKRISFLQVLQGVALIGCAVGVLYLLPNDKTSKSNGDLRASYDTSALDRAFIARGKKRKYRPYHALRVFNKEKSWKGDTLVGINGAEEILLISHDGSIMNGWPIDSDRSRFLPDSCSLLALHGTIRGNKIEPWKSLQYAMREYSWKSDVLWEYWSDGILHHDIHRLEDGNTLVLQRDRVPYRGEKKFDKTINMKADSVHIVSPQGKSIWSWNSYDAFSNDFCGIRDCPSVEEARISTAELKRQRDWSHANTVSLIPENQWFDKGDKRFKPGNVLVQLRNFWMFFIVDKDTKEVVWSFPKKEEFDSNSELQMRGGHEAHMIPKGSPGAGNIIVFDNGTMEVRPYSRILEIDPVERDLVWEYKDAPKFFSRTAGSVQRLPNGNTLISEDHDGRVFEITPEKEVVWELKVPFRTARAKRYESSSCS